MHKQIGLFYINCMEKYQYFKYIFFCILTCSFMLYDWDNIVQYYEFVYSEVTDDN